MPKTCWKVALVMASVSLFLGSSFGARWEDPPPGQPSQMQSNVDYDCKLTDPFFKSYERSYPDGTKSPSSRGDRFLKHTAKCFSTSRGGEHSVRFCAARLIDVNVIDLFIHESNPGEDDALRVQISNGRFTSQYWTEYPIATRPDPALIWTTKRQKLTLDKNVYRKGDVIKGRIDFECVEEPTNPKYIEKWGKIIPSSITVKGVFKTILE